MNKSNVLTAVAIAAFYVAVTQSGIAAVSAIAPVVGNETVTEALSSPPNHREDFALDKDRVEGSAKQVEGTVKETTGKVLGDKKLETEGTNDKAAGKVQNAIGGLKDTLRGK